MAARVAGERMSGGMQPAHPPRDDEQDDQRHRQPDANRKRDHDAIAATLIAVQEYERGEQRADDRDEEDDDNDFDGALPLRPSVAPA